MRITEVRIFPVGQGQLKAYATIIFDDSFLIRGLRVIDNGDGLFVAMPSRKRKDGAYQDMAHPLNSETRALLENAALDAYEAMLERL